MTISKVDSILLKHPFFANMEESRRIAVYNKVYTKVFYERSDITVVNRTTYSTDASYELHLYQSGIKNLSAHKDVDSLMNKESLLKNLTDEQKIVIFEIAAYKINIFRTLQEDQEYYFSTHKADVKPHDTIFAPLLDVVNKILSPIIETLIYRPLAAATAIIISLLSATDYYTPALTISSKIWKLISNIYVYEPLVSATFRVYDGDAFVEVNTHLPLLTIEALIIGGAPRISVVYSPLLSIETQIMVDGVDYIESYTYEPPLEVEYIVA